MGFVHLHSHTEYSVLDGVSGVDRWVMAAKERGFGAMAVTEHGNLGSAMHFYVKARGVGIKPILGCEFYVVDEIGPSQRRSEHVILLAKSAEGLRTLIRLNNRAWREGFYFTPRITYDLLAKDHTDLVCLSACLKGRVPKLVRAGQEDRARSFARKMLEVFGDDFRLEVQFSETVAQQTANKGILDISGDLAVPLVATNDNHYVCAGEDVVQEHLLRLGRNNGVIYDTRELYLKTEEEMREAWKAWHADYFPQERADAAIRETETVAAKVDINLPLGQFYMPKFDPADHPSWREGQDNWKFFVEICLEGWRKKVGPKLARGADEAAYRARMRYEMAALRDLGFVDYMLIVEDVCRFARSRSIPVGPARGSVAGSLVAYVLDITKVDPIEHDLVFERFLNPVRAQTAVPDIDLDFATDRRKEVKDYIVRKYGRSRVASIGSYNRLGVKGALKDLLRLHGVEFRTSSIITKSIRDDESVETAMKTSPILARFARREPAMMKLLGFMVNQIKSVGKHPAGVVIAPSDLDDWLPIRVDTKDGASKEPITQWHDKMVEARGLVKFDILGIDQVSMVDMALNLVEKRHDEKISYEDIPLNDAEVLRAFADGRTTAIFQFNSPLLTGYLKTLKPDCFDDLVAANALVRPGPKDVGMHEVYAAAKRGEDVSRSYLHPSMPQILPKTHGIMVYQEDLMRVVQELAGLTPVESEQLRRAVAKKKGIEAVRDRLVGNLMERDWAEKEAASFWSAIETWGEYGFSKSHAVGYSFLAYVSQWLKIHYPLEFWASVLTYSPDAPDDPQGVLALREKARLESGVEVSPPDINRSGTVFEIDGGGLLWPLSKVQFVGPAVVDAVLKARAGAPFRSFDDFAFRVKGGAMKRATLSLALAGAFRAFGTVADVAMRHYQIRQEKPPAAVRRLTDMDWEFLAERAVGFTRPVREILAGHMKDAVSMEAFLAAKKETPLSVGGTVQSVRKLKTRRGEDMAVLVLGDMDGIWRAVAWPDALREMKEAGMRKLPVVGDIAKVFGKKMSGHHEDPQVEAFEIKAVYRPPDILHAD